MAEKKEEMSPIEMKVAQQMEYYFGDHKFLKEQLQLDDGWVTLETMLKFNRLKSLTTESSVIVEALQKSKTGILEISDDKTKVRRFPNKPLPEVNDEYKDALKHKSVYMKGFPLETSLHEIQEWLNGKGPIENIQMRKTLQRQFKGSVFVCFDTEESSKQFVERSDIKSFKDNEMLVLSREDYHAKKQEERKLFKAEQRDKEQQQEQSEDMQGLLLEEQMDVLEGDEEELKNIIKKKRGRGGRKGRGGRDQGRSQYKCKKMKFESDDEDDEPAAPKREREEADGPAAKVPKTEADLSQ